MPRAFPTSLQSSDLNPARPALLDLNRTMIRNLLVLQSLVLDAAMRQKEARHECAGG